MLAHVPYFGRNPRRSPDFLVYPVPKACMHVLGTGVPRRLGLARSSWSPKAAQALGCRLTPGLRVSFGRVTCMARAASVPGLWTLGFLLFCGICLWVRVVLGFGFRLRPATPGWGDGVCVCLRACSACTPPLLARLCGVGVCAWARVSAAPRHSWLGCWGLCVLVCPLCLYPATPGWGVRCACVCSGSVFGCAPPLLAGVLGCVCACVCAPLVPRHSRLGCAVCVCVCLGSGFGCALPLLAGVFGFVCVCVRALLVPRHSWLGCAAWVCVLGLGFRLRPATPGWGVGVCVFVCPLRLYPATPGWGVRCGRVCLGSGFGCAPPLLAGVCGVGVCAWARVSATPRHSWLGCWGVCVLVCALRLYPATPGWAVRCGCVCLGSGFGCAPPLLAGVLGCVCACVCAPLVPRHSWLGCAVWVCVLGLGFWLRPATPGWGVGVCVCLCARSACTPPLLAGVCGVGVCAWAPVSAAPRHSWLGCAVWVCVLGLGFRLRPATPGWGVGACVLVCALRLYPTSPGWGVRCGCVCLGSGFGCAPPLLAGVLGFCVCLCVRFACTPPLLAGVCGVGVCAWARV